MHTLNSESVPPLDAEVLRSLCLAAGADDVGFVPVDHPAVSAERASALRLLPGTRTLVALACRMNREPVRSPDRSVANMEFHHTGDRVNEVARRIVRELEEAGIAACNPPMAFPMETERWPDRMWTISHKPVAVAAGLGHMGLHRNVIHPRFGSFLLLGTLLLAAPVSRYGEPLADSPCVSCKLCVAACPVGAIAPDGHFDLSACYHHNYREFMGGFADYLEEVASPAHRRTPLAERRPRMVSVWQSLSFGPNYQSGHCVSVCPAGTDVLGPFLADRTAFVQRVVRPLQANTEQVFVIPGSDAEKHLTRRFSHKKRVPVRGSLIPRTVGGFLRAMPLVFQRGAAAGRDAVLHFTFTGSESAEATVTIRNGTLRVEPGHHGVPDTRIHADAATWLGILAGERHPVWAVLTRRLRIRGSMARFRGFQACFPVSDR